MEEPEIPYRTRLKDFTPTSPVSSTDENEYSTLLKVRNDLAADLAQLDNWSAFDLTESELSIKQQIKAHQLAYDILSPIFDALNNTVNEINIKYMEN